MVPKQTIGCFLESISCFGFNSLYRPVPGRWPKVIVNAWWDPSRDPRKRSQQVDCSSHPLAEASPKRGITRERHHPRESLLERGVAREGHRRVKTSPERLRASTIQNSSKGKRKGGFKAISLAPEGGYPDFWGILATAGRPWYRYDP